MGTPGDKDDVVKDQDVVSEGKDEPNKDLDWASIIRSSKKLMDWYGWSDRMEALKLGHWITMNRAFAEELMPVLRDRREAASRVADATQATVPDMSEKVTVTIVGIPEERSSKSMVRVSVQGVETEVEIRIFYDWVKEKRPASSMGSN